MELIVSRDASQEKKKIPKYIYRDIEKILPLTIFRKDFVYKKDPIIRMFVCLLERGDNFDITI